VLRVHIVASSLSIEAVLTTDVHAPEEIAVHSISALDVYIYAEMSSLTGNCPFLSSDPDAIQLVVFTYYALT